MDIVKLYKFYRIPYQTEGHKHCRPGWIQTICPFCSGNPGFHLGFCMDESSTFYNRFVCWRCGGKGTNKTLQKLTGESIHQIKEAIPDITETITRARKKSKIRHKSFKWPSLMSDKLSPKHIKYLEKRGYNPTEIQQKYDIKATNYPSFLDNIDFSNRIIIPIRNKEGEIVSFQSRDITEKHKLKYISCPSMREIEHHKYLLYGENEIKSNRIIIVEGVFDVWTIGQGAVSGFGSSLSKQQLIKIQKYEEAVIVFDGDNAGKEGAKKVQKYLELLGVNTICLYLEEGEDPSRVGQKINEILKEIKWNG